MPSAKRVLGRGLADLIPVGGDAAGDNRSVDLGPGQEMPVAMLHPNPRQPRTRFDESALAELAESVKTNGILQPILVRPRTAGGYEIVAGERRYRAALKVGLKQVPVVVRRLTDEETLALALIENLIREDIGPLETARAFQRLMDDFGWTQEEMGRRVGKSRSAVSNTLRLLSLPEPIQQSVERGDLTEGHARALIGDERHRNSVPFREHQLNIWRQAVARGLSVRDVERMMKAQREDEQIASPNPVYTFNDGSASPKAETVVSIVEMRAVEDRLRTALGTQVRLTGSEGRGRIEIEFFSPEELEGLLTRFETPPEEKGLPQSAAVSGGRGSGGRIQGLLAARR